SGRSALYQRPACRLDSQRKPNVSARSPSKLKDVALSVYPANQPPLRAAGTAADPDRFVFVRDGFSWWAFLLTPLWMLWHRLWLALIVYLVFVAGMDGLLRRVG